MSRKFEKLTREAMRALPPDKRIVEHGITYIKLQNGDGRFQACIMVNGKRIHRVIGNESEGITRTHAEQAIEKFKHSGRENRLSLPKGRKLPMAFKQAAKQYLERLELEGGKNIPKKKQQLEQYLVPFFSDTALTEISSFDVERFKKHCLDQGLSTSTVNRFLAVLTHLFNKAIDWCWIQYAPARIKKYKENASRTQYLTVPQINTLLEKAKKDDHPIIYPFVLIALETSMRRMEILSIRIENIDLERQLIYIHHAKAGAREQPMTPYLADYLKDYLAENAKPKQEWLFPSETSETGHFVTIERAFRRVVKAAELDPAVVTRHTLRHTAISHLVQAWVDLPTVRRISGHKSLQMVERYAHQNMSHVQDALSKLRQRYGG